MNTPDGHRLSEAQMALASHLIPWAMARTQIEALHRLSGYRAVAALAIISRVVLLGEPVSSVLANARATSVQALYAAQEMAIRRYGPLGVSGGESGERLRSKPLPFALVQARVRAQLESWQRARDMAVKLLQTAGSEGRAIVLLVFRIAVLGEALEGVAQSVQEPDASLLVAALDQALLDVL